MKLVRDMIPEIIEGDGSWCLTRKVYGPDEHMVFLKAKMEEETSEFIENPCYEEAADMLAVLEAFCHINGLDWNIVESVALDKTAERGGFTAGIVLQKVGKNV